MLCLLTLSLWTAAPAWADPAPKLQSATPQALASHRSVNVEDVRANYDRDLSAASTIEVRDSANAVVPGTSGLDGPDSPTLGKRTIRFQPSAPLAEGGYKVTAVAWAASGVSTDSWTFTIDDTAPLAPAVSSPSNGQVVFDQPVLVRGTGEPGAFALVLEGGVTIVEDRVAPDGVFAIQLPYPPEDGVVHSISMRLRDTAGNIGATTGPITFTHDSVTVVPQILQPLEGAFLNSTSVYVAGWAKRNTAITIYEGATIVGSSAADGQGDWSTTVTFAPGVHTITATSFDGNVTDGPSAARTFTVDITAPAVPVITSPAAGQTVSTNPVPISGTAEPLSSVEIREAGLLRGTAATDASGAWTVAIGFSEGAHTIEARAVDRAGNVSVPASRAFSVDTTAPAPPVIDAPADGSVLSTSNVTVAGRAELGTTVRIVRGTVTIGTAVTDGSGNWATSIALADGAYTIVAFAEDAAGNVSLQSRAASFAVDTLAPAAPVIVTPGAGQTLATTSVKISGTAEQASLVVLKEGATTIGTAPTSSENLWSVTVTLPIGAHTITATAMDNAGNVSVPSAPRTFTIAIEPGDTTPPEPPTITSPVADSINQAAVIFAGQAEPGARVRIYDEIDFLTSATASASGYWTVTALETDGLHEVFATARDAAGNISAESAVVPFTVDATRPTVEIETPSETLFLTPQETTINGIADDNNAVIRVSLEYYNLLGQLVLRESADTCTGCPATSVTWQATPELLPGIYSVDAYAIDVVENRSLVESIRIIRL